VGSTSNWIVPLDQATDRDERTLGGKAAKLAQLAQAGFHVPTGFCITTSAYAHFLHEANLTRVIRMELGRKPFESMRWEEIWDTALRIRSAFLTAPVPETLAQAIGVSVARLGPGKRLAVRSSAPGEDAADRSFAGLHESVVGVAGVEAVLDAVRVVWASLWSDAALLYRQELSLDPAQSQMAVVVQELVDEDRSGVAFGRDPRNVALDRAVVEAVPGPCADLVDGLVDPDRWILDRSTGQVLEWRPGLREDAGAQGQILEEADLENLLGMLHRVESLFRWPPDTEWTGRGERFTLLQARPITTAAQEADDQRGWYLSLRPGMRRLNALSKRVSEELIPRLESLGQRFAAEAIEVYDDLLLAAAIEERYASVQEWRQIYLEDFIPFAHGVRQLGTYYNDIVRPDDPYEFVGLLKGERMMAVQRNERQAGLAARIRRNQALQSALQRMVGRGDGAWLQAREELRHISGGAEFVQAFEDLRDSFMDVAYGSERLSDRPDLLLQTLLEMARATKYPYLAEAVKGAMDTAANALERRLLDAVGPDRQDEAREVLNIGRLSWRLRDDDNVLVGRLESQLLRALNCAADRLRAGGRLRETDQVTIPASPALAQALRASSGGRVTLPEPKPEEAPLHRDPGERPRQLVGQPAAPGLASGRVRVIGRAKDLGRFRAGEVLVCDAIQPMMTHLVPLAAAIVERRGGMLIHGAIIARELGVPCVNGIANASQLLEDGETVTVDGYLGIVTVGPPEFALEART
jgi:phosphohistidine swiveling domain-containing protein